MKKPFFVRHKGALKRVNAEDILIIEANGNYVSILLADGSVLKLVRSTMKAAVKSFPDEDVVQITRYAAVSLHFLEFIDRDTVIIKLPKECKLEIQSEDLQSGTIHAERIQYRLDKPYRKGLEARIAILGREEKEDKGDTAAKKTSGKEDLQSL